MIQGKNWKVFQGSNLDVLPTLEDNSVDAIVTDPPYELGFMGKKWDSSGIAYNVELWRECLRVLKPGGHLLSFGGSRTWHRIAVAIEDAGFEVRDSIAWMYGSGFPKSLDISKAIDKNNGESGRKLKFTLWFRSTSLTVKQVTDVLRSAGLISENGTMASHFFAQSYAGQPAIPTAEMWQVIRPLVSQVPDWIDELIQRTEAEREVIGQKTSGIANKEEKDRHTIGASKAVEVDITAPATPEAQQWEGWGTALKPAFEPVIVARKPLIGTVAENVLTYGTGGLNIGGSRIGTEKRKNNINDFSNQHGNQFGNGERIEKLGESEVTGRWPANVILDPYTAELLDEQSGISKSGKPGIRTSNGFNANAFGNGIGIKAGQENGEYGDSGGASRFFYVAKASKRDRNEGLEEIEGKEIGAKGNGLARTCAICGASIMNPCDCPDRTFVNPVRQNFHPTVKPTDLMRYLIKLVTPPGGVVLDPFTGSGSTGKAAILEGFDFIGIELTGEYLPIIEGRLKWAEAKVAEEEAKQDEALF